MSKIYILSLKLKSGLLTELQSDTVFGHFCWRLKDIKGKDKLKEFLNLYLENKPVFTVSNSFFGDKDKDNIYFPKPLITYEYDFVEKSKKEKITNFLKYKDRKKIKNLTLNEFNASLTGNTADLDMQIEKRLKEGKEIPKFKKDLRVSVEIDRNTFSSKGGQLFSYAPNYLHNDYTLNLFIKVIDGDKYDSFKCENILKEVFIIGFGKKKSSGYGEFEITNLDENKRFKEYKGFIEPTESNGFISLGNYLPAETDNLTDFFYETHLKYTKLGEEYALSENPFKKPIIFMIPGSVFKTSAKKEYYGRCTKNGEISSVPGVIQNGFAFSLKIKV